MYRTVPLNATSAYHQYYITILERINADLVSL